MILKGFYIPFVIFLSFHLKEFECLQAVWGIFPEELPTPVFYETFIPLIFEYQEPRWNKTEVTFNNWYSCITETFPYRLSCPMAFHMNSAILNLHQDFEWLSPVQDSKSSSINNKFYWEKFRRLEDFCFTIQKHFDSPYMPRKKLDNYIDWITNCSLAGEFAQIERNIGSYNYSIRSPFSKMEVNFYKTFYTAITAFNTTQFELVASAALSNSRMAIQGTLLSAYYAEKNRWNHALSECQAKRIPHSLLTSAKLNDTLNTLKEKLALRNSQFELSINPAEYISKYYQLPLADCAHTENTFAVRILVPVVRKAAPVQVNLLKITPIPFAYDGSICQLKINGNSENMRNFLQIGQSIFKTDCKPGELCQLDENFKMLNQLGNLDTCVQAIYSKSYENLHNSCAFECSNSSLIKDMIISRLSPDKLAITGTVGSVKIYCSNNNQNPKELLLSKDLTGAILTQLPCNCWLEIQTEDQDSEVKVYKPENPCSQNTMEVQANSIVPIHFLKFVDSKVLKTLNAGDGLEIFPENTKISTELADFYCKKPTTMMDLTTPPILINPDNLNLSRREEDTGHWVIFWLVVSLILIIQGYILWEFRKFSKSSLVPGLNMLNCCRSCSSRQEPRTDESELIQ